MISLLFASQMTWVHLSFSKTYPETQLLLQAPTSNSVPYLLHIAVIVALENGSPPEQSSV